MPRRNFAQEAIHMDHLRSSPSQQHLDPTSRSSTSSQADHDDELEHEMATARAGSSGMIIGGSSGGPGELMGAQRLHKIDLYSIPVFLLECLILGALAYGAYYLHYVYKFEPLVSGFYCDDTSLRQSFSETRLIKEILHQDREMQNIVLLMTVPIVVVVFCELVNSMFGSLKFRQIRALCKCCKLHSITRRTLRFSGAYLLGFLLVMISCDFLATTAGRFRPYLAIECPQVYNECFKSPSANPQAAASTRANGMISSELAAIMVSSTMAPALASLNDATSTSVLNDQQNANMNRPLSQPISSSNLMNVTDLTQPSSGLVPASASGVAQSVRRVRRDTSSSAMLESIDKNVLRRQWIELDYDEFKEKCQFSGDDLQLRKFNNLAMSWPSFPGAIISYVCFYVASYLSFVGTARPFRLITSVLVIMLLLAATVFNVQLVKEHYQHWEDVAAGAGLALVIVLFVLTVYLNKFRDTHYYENQKFYGSASRRQQQLRQSLMMDGTPYKMGGYSNEAGQYHLDKIDGGHMNASAPVVQNMQQNGADPTVDSNNDLAMRYFQIPRANYRGAPRPLSTVNRN